MASLQTEAKSFEFLTGPGILCWEYLVRFPQQGRPNRAYIRNQNRAVQIFQEWLDSSSENYFTMLYLAQTSALVEPYYLNGTKNTKMDASEVEAGRIRWRDISHSFPLSNYLEILSRLAAIARSKRVADTGASEWKNPIEGVAPEYWPRNFALFDSEDNIVELHHYYPPFRHVLDYIESAGQQMRNIRRDLKRGVERDVVLRELCQYFHTAINGHIFPRVNNSILMGQVNLILRRIGMNPISHDKLDYWAFVLPPDVFVPVMMDFIFKNQKLERR